MEGFGTFKWSDGRILEYQGQFKKNLRHGTGTYNLFNGDVVVGNSKEAKMHGKMVRVALSGEVFDEIYIDDVFQSSVQQVTVVSL